MMLSKTISFKPNCLFCNYSRGDELKWKNKYGFVRESLLISESLFILPDIAPLVENHLLIVSRDHFRSMTEFNSADIGNELSRFKKKVIDFHKSLGYYSTFFFEHGSCGEIESSSCIVHSHLHAIPMVDEKSLKSICNTVEDDLEIMIGDGKVCNYISFSIENGCTKYFEDTCEKQYLRKVISDSINRKERHLWQKYISSDTRKVAIKFVEHTQYEWKFFIANT